MKKLLLFLVCALIIAAAAFSTETRLGSLRMEGGGVSDTNNASRLFFTDQTTALLQTNGNAAITINDTGSFLLDSHSRVRIGLPDDDLDTVGYWKNQLGGYNFKTHTNGTVWFAKDIQVTNGTVSAQTVQVTDLTALENIVASNIVANISNATNSSGQFYSATLGDMISNYGGSAMGNPIVDLSAIISGGFGNMAGSIMVLDEFTNTAININGSDGNITATNFTAIEGGGFIGNGSGLTNLPVTGLALGATNQLLANTGAGGNVWTGNPQVTNLTALGGATIWSNAPSTLALTVNGNQTNAGSIQAAGNIVGSGVNSHVSAGTSGGNVMAGAAGNIYFSGRAGFQSTSLNELLAVRSDNGVLANLSVSNLVAKSQLTATNGLSFGGGNTNWLHDTGSAINQVTHTNGAMTAANLTLSSIAGSTRFLITSSAGVIQNASTASAASSTLAGSLTDETGTGLAVFNNNPIFSGNITSTNGVFGSYASWAMNTNQTFVLNAATNVIGGFTKTKSFGGAFAFGTQAVTNLLAGDRTIWWGSGFTVPTGTKHGHVQVWTNGVNCDEVDLSATSAGSALSETGFKILDVFLPANCYVELRFGSEDNDTFTVVNTVFRISPSN